MSRPELSLDAGALNARLTRLEEQLASGEFVQALPARGEAPAAVTVAQEIPAPADTEEQPAPQKPVEDAAPVGFWTDLFTSVRAELNPPQSGFFAPNPKAPIQGALAGDTIFLRCSTSSIVNIVDKPEVTQIVCRKASAMLGRKVQVKVVDVTAAPQTGDKLDRLLNFGRAHSDVIKIKE
jgi:hypothetical protein